MRPGRGAGSPSCLALNPRNREASAGRRVKLLAAFDSLPEDDRADLLELVESMVGRGAGDAGVMLEARRLVHQVYTAAGWDDGRARA